MSVKGAQVCDTQNQPAVPTAAGLGCVSSQMSTYSSRSGLGTALKGICFTLLNRFLASSIKHARTCQ